jgi:hypothetical protein
LPKVGFFVKRPRSRVFWVALRFPENKFPAADFKKIYLRSTKTINRLTLLLPPSRLYWLVLPFAAILGWFGTRNHPDPAWIEAGELLKKPIALLSDVPDSLQLLYCQIHGLPFRAGDTTALHLVSQPSRSNIEWTAFKRLTWTAVGAERHRKVIAGVTGTGATKQTRRAANLLAGDPDRVLPIECAPQFDLDFHKRYIGYKDEKGKFQRGEMLRFWERCRQNSDQKFVAVIDNFDKINPETFFGPALWEALSSSKKQAAEVGGEMVEVPANFYLLSVTHLGPGSMIEFNEEHFKRLGSPFVLEPNAGEMLAVLRLQAQKNDESTERLAALRDTAQMHRFLFYFLKINHLLGERYPTGYQMGQGTNLRSLYCDSDRTELKQSVLNHLNALKPNRKLTLAAFEPFDRTIENGGLESGSNFVAQQVQILQDSGYFVEITMVGATALLTALAGWWVFRRREQLIRRYGERAQQVYAGFETQQISAEAAARRLEEIKHEVDGLVLRRRLGYTEGLYFLAFIEDRAKRIEFARNVSENFLELFNAFMEDNVLTENEYLKLRQFLQTIRHKIPPESYEQFSQKVEQAYAANSFGA